MEKIIQALLYEIRQVLIIHLSVICEDSPENIRLIQMVSLQHSILPFITLLTRFPISIDILTRLLLTYQIVRLFFTLSTHRMRRMKHLSKVVFIMIIPLCHSSVTNIL